MSKIRDPREIAKWVNAYNNKRNPKNDYAKCCAPFFINGGEIKVVGGGTSSPSPSNTQGTADIKVAQYVGVSGIKHSVTPSTSNCLTIGPMKPTGPSMYMPDGVVWDCNHIRYEATCYTCKTMSVVRNINFFNEIFHNCDTCLADIRYHNNGGLKST